MWRYPIRRWFGQSVGYPSCDGYGHEQTQPVIPVCLYEHPKYHDDCHSTDTVSDYTNHTHVAGCISVLQDSLSHLPHTLHIFFELIGFRPNFGRQVVAHPCYLFSSTS